MKKLLSLALCLALALCCLPAVGEAVSVTGKVTEIEKYGHALLDVTIEDFNAAGFALGDIVSVKAGTFEGDMPYFNGYYVEKGETMLRAYPGQTCIAVCINYGKFAETAGIGVGDEVTISLKEKAGALTLQEISNLVYTNERADYESDEVFTNFRVVNAGEMAEGMLLRSCSPIDDSNKRAETANALVEKAGAKAVMNMANTQEELEALLNSSDNRSAYYTQLAAEGKVIALGMPINFSSDEFAEGIVKGFTFLSENEPPYLVHCTEGKDRAGFACMLLEMLLGASLDEVVNDYLQSYINYYHIDPEAEAEKLDMLAKRNVYEMLRAVAGLESIDDVQYADLSNAAGHYLLNHGMDENALLTLVDKLDNKE